MNGSGLEHSPPIGGSPNHRDRVVTDAPRLDRPAMSHHSQHIAAREEDLAVNGLAQPGRAFENGVEYGLDVRRRARDDAQDLSSGGLLCEAVRQLLIALLQLREQAHVLDGDHGLVREGLEECDLLIGERRDLGAPELDGADGHAFAQEWHAKKRAMTMLARE